LSLQRFTAAFIVAAGDIWMPRRFSALLSAALLIIWTPLAAQPQPAQHKAPEAPTTAPASAGPSAPGPVSIEDFARLPFLSDALLSPDGRRIAGRVSHDGNEGIAIWTLSEGVDQVPQHIAVEGNEAFTWASDTKLLITTRTTIVVAGAGTVVPIPLQRIQSYDLAARKLTVLGPQAGFMQELIFIDPAGRYVLLSNLERFERPPNVVRVDLETGATVVVQPGQRGVYSWFADSDGVVRVGADYGERRTRIYYRATAQAPLTLVETRRNLQDDSVIDAVRFITNTSRGTIVTNAETGRFAVYEYDFATDTRGATLFSHPDVDVTRAIYGTDGRVDGILYDDDRPRVRWLNPDMERLQARIDRSLPDHTNLIINRSRDNNRVLIFSSAADDPGTYYVFDQAARRMEIFASPYDNLVGRSFAPVRPISYQSRDGLTIHGYLTLPPGRGERGLPLIILPHGGPFYRDSWSFDPEVQFLVSRGYAVLQPNFRGSTGYGRSFVERGYGQLGGGMVDDMEDGMDWLVREGIADPRRVCIVGSSYGGYAAIWGAMRNPDRYRCAISFAGPTDLRGMLRHSNRFFVARRYARERRLELQGEDRLDLNDISPLRHPELLRVPLLLGHGEQDPTVPVDQGRRFIRALARNPTRVESVFYPKSGHGFSEASESVDWMRRMDTFLAQHNPANAPPTATASR
jgi:dipeptidyl aminopeptidase/acylaminoacyl peptidase